MGRFINQDKIKDVEMIYTELYILRQKKDMVFKLAKLGLRTQTKFGFNLPAPFFIKMFKDSILELIEYADIVYANKNESIFFAENILCKVAVLFRAIFRFLKYALKFAK